MKINKNFIGSRMNKSLDERLIPPGDYIDALNIRVSSDEDGEALSAENAKGNELLATPKYNGSDLVGAKCIGAFEDGANETIYWFITSTAVDMIVSFNTKNESLKYHVVSVSVLNFNDKYLINGINLIDNFLFFTDNYNQPRKINVKSSYPEPISGVDQITEDDISVIVKPPIESPSLTLLKKSNKANYIEDKFIRFAYRYKYKDGEYSALSEFSDLAFDPGVFRIDYGTYDMVGMRNSANSVLVTMNTGSKNVVGVDLCFKLSNTNVINVVERYDKEENGWTDNEDVTIEFSNQKIYTTLPQSELIRVYDNVPKKAKAQTTIGNRIMYGNYVDGHNIDTVLNYSLDLINEDIGLQDIPVDSSDGIAYAATGGGVIQDSAIELDFTGLELIEGGSLFIDFNIQNNSFGGDASYVDGSEAINSFTDGFEFVFPRDYTSLGDLVSDPEFIKAIDLTDTVGFPDKSYVDGYSLSDLFYSNITLHGSGNWQISGGGVTTSPEGFKVSSSVNSLIIQVPAVIYEDTTNPGTFAYEYFSMSSTNGSIVKISDTKSLHSNRDYEVGIVYLDEYNRASTALVCNDNTVYVGPEYSKQKNYITTTINHLAPSWAKRYRLVMKPSKAGYETIYVNQYYYDTSESSWWLKLEGDNQTSFKVGDDLIVKRSSTGPVSTLVKTKVLELKTQEKFFISNTEIEKFPPTSGLFMRIRPTNFSISNSVKEDVDYGYKGMGVPNGNLNLLGIAYPSFIENPETPGSYIDYDIPAGSEVRIFFQINQNKGSYFGSERFVFDRTFTATQDYDNLYDFIVGESIDFNKPTNNPTIESTDDTTIARFESSVGTISNQGSSEKDGTLYVFSGGSNYEENVIGIRYATIGTYDTSDYKSYLTFRTGGRKRNSKWYYLDAHIQVFRSSGVLVFETIPDENTNEIYYESHKSYPITEDRYHSGDIQNQTSTLPAILNLDMFNCFSFGNGVESFKIDDGLAKPGFNIGERVTAVSEQDYKETHRYADITYSGVYNEETNLNKLNEFNLSLVNFKTLERNFGPIEVLHARQSDILVLQEDKVSYVLANGKNLFSDASAGGAILSTPDVLGQQVPRIEEFGISNNPESFSVYGPNVFFTDVKRGAVINLKGEQLNTISSLGMRSWFRDQFLGNKDKIHLGGYDPYMNEYVLSLTEGQFESTLENVNCGFSVSQESSSSVLVYNVDLKSVNGDVDIDYSISSGTVDISVVYNGSQVINQSVSLSGTLTFSKDQQGVDSCFVTITPTNATYNLQFGCPQADELTVIRIVKNTNVMNGLTIGHEYSWSDGSYTSPVVFDQILFGQGPVSLYRSSTGLESFGSIPSDGSIVTLKYRKSISDTAEWDFDTFKYLVSDTLYSESDIDTLTPLLQEAAPLPNVETNVYEAAFTYNNPADYSYLYLVWDYIEPLTATFDTAGGNETYSNQSGVAPLSVTSPGTPTRSGYTFIGWSPSIPTTISSDTTFTALWEYVEPIIECNTTLSASGSQGIYELELELGTDIGDTTVTFDSIGVPDRFQIEWDGAIVVDSLFVGDSLPNTTNENEIINVTSLPLFRYTGSDFVQDGTQVVNYDSADIANSSTARPTSGDGSIGNQLGVVGGYPSGTPLASDGNVKLRFNKVFAYPTKAKIIVTGVNSGTAWSIDGIECPTGSSTNFVTATFDSNGGNETYSSQTGVAPLNVTSPGTPTRSGYTFTGWSPSLPTTINANTTFIAQWEMIELAPVCNENWTLSDMTQNSTTFVDFPINQGYPTGTIMIGLNFSQDGSKMVCVRRDTQKTKLWFLNCNLSTSWDPSTFVISTIKEITQSTPMSATGSVASGAFFSPDGREMYISYTDGTTSGSYNWRILTIASTEDCIFNDNLTISSSNLLTYPVGNWDDLGLQSHISPVTNNTYTSVMNYTNTPYDWYIFYSENSTMNDFSSGFTQITNKVPYVRALGLATIGCNDQFLLYWDDTANNTSLFRQVTINPNNTQSFISSLAVPETSPYVSSILGSKVSPDFSNLYLAYANGAILRYITNF